LRRPVILFVAVIVLIGSSQIFEEPFILTHALSEHGMGSSGLQIRSAELS